MVHALEHAGIDTKRALSTGIQRINIHSDIYIVVHRHAVGIRTSTLTYAVILLYTVTQHAPHTHMGMSCTFRITIWGGMRTQVTCICGWLRFVAMAICLSRMHVHVDVLCGMFPSTSIYAY